MGEGHGGIRGDANVAVGGRGAGRRPSAGDGLGSNETLGFEELEDLGDRTPTILVTPALI